MQLNNSVEQKGKATSLLIEAEKLLSDTELTDEYIVLYQLLANMHKENGNLSKAYYWQQKYSTALLKAAIVAKPKIKMSTEQTAQISALTNASAINQTRQLAVKLAEKSELAISFAKKYQQQRTLIFILSGIAFILFNTILFLWLKRRTKKLKATYDTLEKPSDVIATPIQTKQLYQKNFNMARKYSYPLTIGYISISNWQALTFQFSKKIITEVDREIASIINKHINDFEDAGLISNGEYLILFPHQDSTDVEYTMNKLISALKLRFFANLGKFSVTITYSVGSPNFQDIDPYIFLSQLSDSAKTI